MGSAHHSSDDRELRLAYTQLLEGRRLSYDSGLWQVPTLIVAGQALLLNVLTKPTVKGADAWVIAAAGVVASLAAVLALWVQRRREREFAGRVTRFWTSLPSPMPSPNRSGAGDNPGWDRLRSGAMVWSVVQCAFIGADVWLVNGASQCARIGVLSGVAAVVLVVVLGVGATDRRRDSRLADAVADERGDPPRHGTS